MVAEYRLEVFQRLCRRFQHNTDVLNFSIRYISQRVAQHSVRFFLKLYWTRLIVPVVEVILAAISFQKIKEV